MAEKFFGFTTCTSGEEGFSETPGVDRPPGFDIDKKMKYWINMQMLPRMVLRKNLKKECAIICVLSIP